MAVGQASRTFFGFADARSGALVRLAADGDSYALCADPEAPVFEARTASQLATILFENTPSYNTTAEVPGWGPFARESLRPVRAHVVTCVEPVELPKALKVKTISVREIPRKVAERYAGQWLPSEAKEFMFWLVELPAGETVASVASRAGTILPVDKYTARRVYAAVDTPEEYVPLLEGRPGALLVASELVDAGAEP